MDWLAAIWMLGPVLVLPVAFIRMCCCTNNGCADICSDQDATDTFQVTISGVADGTCSPCGFYNATRSLGGFVSGTIAGQCNPVSPPCCKWTVFGGGATCGGSDCFLHLFDGGGTVGAWVSIGRGALEIRFQTNDVGIGSSLPENCESISGVSVPVLSNTTGCDVSAASCTITAT